jgi:hypothetical protein
MNNDAGVKRIGLAGGILFILLVMGCVGLPASADEDPGYVPREYFGALLEPKDTVLHGAGQDDKGFSDYAELMGPQRWPVLYMTYTSVTRSKQHVLEWGEKIKRDLAEQESGNLIPQIGLNLTGENETGDGKDSAIADGLMDENIDAFCEIIKALDRPVFVRIGYEFEGSWNGYQPESFKAGWIHITKAMRRHGLKFATVWCSAGASAGDMPLADRMAYYPGDEWVDWWGIDLFDAHEALSPQTAEFCDEAGKHRKPVMIGEATARHTGVLDGQASWDKWFVPFFQLIRQQPEIKSFCYINWEWSEWSDRLGFGWHDWGDCRLEKNDVVTQHYRDEMDLPLYLHDNAEAQSETTP